MNKWMLSLIFLLPILSCKEKKDPGPIVSVLSYLKGQVKSVDTISTPILKIEIVNGKSDTSVITKEEFRKQSEEFLNIPDISTKSRRRNYHQTSDYDDITKKVFTTYTALDEDDEIRRETVISQPNANGDTEITSILVNTIETEKNFTIEKNMTWHADQRFQVVTKITKTGEPENMKVLVVKWK